MFRRLIGEYIMSPTSIHSDSKLQFGDDLRISAIYNKYTLKKTFRSTVVTTDQTTIYKVKYI